MKYLLNLLNYHCLLKYCMWILCELNLVADYNNFIIPTEDTMSCSLIDCIWIKIDINYCSYQSVGLIYIIFNLLSISVTLWKTHFFSFLKACVIFYCINLSPSLTHNTSRIRKLQHCSMTSCHVYSYLLQNGTRSFVKSHDHF